MFLIIIIVIYELLPSNLQESISVALNFGFEIFVNYFNTGKFSSNSTEDLSSMYILPSQIRTYFLGDGFYANPIDPNTYYKGVDVGYLRMLYYFGIPGLLLFLCYQYTVFISMMKKSQNNDLFVFLFVLTIILNLKGLTDFSYIIFLFFFAYIKKVHTFIINS